MGVEEAVENSPQSVLDRALERAAQVCEQTIEELREEPGSLSNSRFLSVALLASSAFETAIRARETPQQSELALMIAATLGREAADTARAHGLDERLLRCAEACDAAVVRCETALARRGSTKP